MNRQVQRAATNRQAVVSWQHLGILKGIATPPIVAARQRGAVSWSRSLQLSAARLHKNRTKKYGAAISGCNSHPPSELGPISAMLSIGLTTMTGFKISEISQIHNLGAFSRVLGVRDCKKCDFQKDAGPAKGLADCTIRRDAMTGSLPSIGHRKPKCFLGVRF